MNSIAAARVIIIKKGKKRRFFSNFIYINIVLGEYGFNCEMNKCSVSEDVCEKFKNKWVTKFLNFRIIRIPIKNDRSFLNEIKKCSKNQIANSICMNSKSCLKINKTALNEDRFGLSKDCPCSKKRPYKCMKNFCAVNKETCKIFENHLGKEKRSLLQLPKCKNAIKLNFF